MFSAIKPDMKIVREEIFLDRWYVRCLSRIRTRCWRAVTIQLTGWQRRCGPTDIHNAHHLAERLRAGTVWINCYNMFDAASPFGGYKQAMRG